MCSILAVFALDTEEDCRMLRREALERSGRQRHRGPDWTGIHCDDLAILVHERLAIIDPEGGSQPITSSDRALILVVNGEIYNYQELRSESRRPYEYLTHSDSEVINALYKEDPPEIFLNRLNGIFAFALWDRETRRAIIARDPIGVCPLYWGHDSKNRLWISSEMKALVDLCTDVSCFPPGHFFDTGRGELVKYYDRPWTEYRSTVGVSIAPEALREGLENSVKRQLMSDVPFGVLLSGGLDSSLVAACAAKFTLHRASNGAGGLQSFAIGLNGSPDLAAAEIAASALGTHHHGLQYTVDEGLDMLPDVIRHIESYDLACVRSAIPMYLLARRIRSMGLKMVLSGEGSDEIFGGYLYFYKAPSPQEFHQETLRKLESLHLSDCLRANKAMMAWGIEARVPFLDREFLDIAMQMDASAKMSGGTRMEKAVLREAFEGYLPNSILWRRKEQFSDGVGHQWIDALKAHAETCVNDSEFEGAAIRFAINPPQSKEAYLYRRIFERYFPGPAGARTVPGGKSIACSSPFALSWDPSFARIADPSGRSIASAR